ncbi:bacteriophage abortive infection AbiH family protein [Segatella bryantii]|uniref:bacteriophage abortive infection AbiH family protein n=1 Tax=Segatella bryantii TaxID=77095 RepID=UPI0015A4A512|nr:bacteriophage abortive infection AbiH family protein [Segatella bryantii]
MEQLELFPDFGIKDDERLYVIGNGFDVHHRIESKYSDFEKWVRKNKDSDLVNLMDTFFSNARDFWNDIEKALGEYNEESITDFCEPENPEDFKYDHPGQWQAGIEDSIPYIFGEVMDNFRNAFCEWVNNIDITVAKADLQLPQKSKYLTFNYTETLERCYHIPEKNVLHIHGNRMVVGDEFVLGHNSNRDTNEPYGNDDILFPYQNAYNEVIEIMNRWKKATDSIIDSNKQFFQSLHVCKAVSVMGVSYNGIDLPYLREISTSVAPNCKWILYYYSKNDYENAENVANILGLKDYCLKKFE